MAQNGADQSNVLHRECMCADFETWANTKPMKQHFCTFSLEIYPTFVNEALHCSLPSTMWMSKKKCFSFALRHTLVVLEMH